MTILLIILAVIYGGGFFGMGLLIYRLGSITIGGGGWRAIPDAIIVGAVWPYILWNWTR